MGKILIVKGADFSENGMQIDFNLQPIQIDGEITISRNYDVSGASGAGDGSLANITKFDLTEYINLGYNKITATLKSPGLMIQCLELSNLDGSSYVRPETEYVTTVIETSIDISKPYLRYSTQRPGSTYGSSSYLASALATITLSYESQT